VPPHAGATAALLKGQHVTFAQPILSPLLIFLCVGATAEPPSGGQVGVTLAPGSTMPRTGCSSSHQGSTGCTSAAPPPPLPGGAGTRLNVTGSSVGLLRATTAVGASPACTCAVWDTFRHGPPLALLSTGHDQVCLVPACMQCGSSGAAAREPLATINSAEHRHDQVCLVPAAAPAQF
jgi:hypothetical protein